MMWMNQINPVSRHVRWLLCCMLGATCLSSTGCMAIKTLAVMAAPTTEKVPAEFNRLPNKTALVHVWATPEVLWDYPKLRLDLSAYVSAYLSKNVRGVTMVEPVRVEAAIERGNSMEIDPVELGKQFQADFVIHLAIYQFSMRDPGMAHFYRGRIGSSVVVYDLTQRPQPAERVPLKDVQVAVPDDKTVGYTNVRPDQIRQATYDAFAVEVGKKFHEYERPVD